MTDADRVQVLLDRAAIVDVMSAYATGLDARDWTLWRSVFLDEVLFDLSSWSGQPARRLDADRVVAVGYQGSVYFSEDGGETWHKGQVPTNRLLYTDHANLALGVAQVGHQFANLRT